MSFRHPDAPMGWFISVVMMLSMLSGLGTIAHGQDSPHLFDTESLAVREAFAPAAARARGGVIGVLRDGRPVALGTVMTESGLALTKASELTPPRSGSGIEPEAGSIAAALSDGTTAEVEVVAINRQHDLALLRIDRDGLEPVAWADPETVKIGQWLIVPGLDEVPEAVGIYSAMPRKVAGVRLGINFGPSRRGPVIGYTLPGMGAREAGLQPGDLIRAIGERATPTTDDVIDSLRDVNAGDVVPIVIERRGVERTVPVEMRLRKPNPRSRVDRMNTMGNDVSRRRDGFPAVFQHDATISPQQCGGPALNLDGQAVGINIARAGRIEAFALPADVVFEVFAELQPTLQVNTQEVDEPATPTR